MGGKTQERVLREYRFSNIGMGCKWSSALFFKVAERKKTPAEIREEYERLQRERDERRLQQRTNPKVVKLLAALVKVLESVTCEI